MYSMDRIFGLKIKLVSYYTIQITANILFFLFDGTFCIVFKVFHNQLEIPIYHCTMQNSDRLELCAY